MLQTSQLVLQDWLARDTQKGPAERDLIKSTRAGRKQCFIRSRYRLVPPIQTHFCGTETSRKSAGLVTKRQAHRPLTPGSAAPGHLLTPSRLQFSSRGRTSSDLYGDDQRRANVLHSVDGILLWELAQELTVGHFSTAQLGEVLGGLASECLPPAQ